MSKLPRRNKPPKYNDMTAQEKQSLAPAQKEFTACRELAIASRRKNPTATPKSPVGQGEGPSSINWKGVNHENSGSIDPDVEDLDIETQVALLKSLKREYKSARKVLKARIRAKSKFSAPEREYRAGNTSATQNTAALPSAEVFAGLEDHEMSNICTSQPASTRENSMRPVTQIPAESFIGHTLKGLDKFHTQRKSSQCNGPSSSESNSSGNLDRSPHMGNNPAEPRSVRKSYSKRHSKKSQIKPIAPKEYNGSPDSRTYNRFVMEGTAYVKDGRVPHNQRVFMLSYYLRGVAYDFYIQKVSMNFETWTLHKFVKELFNYVFPIDFWMEQHARLTRAYQNDKQVAAYVHELEELYNMIGSVNECERVIKLWNGLRLSIQQELWRDCLNPEISTWNDVVDHAEIIEISKRVIENENSNSDQSQFEDSGESDGEGRSYQSGRSGPRPLHPDGSRTTLGHDSINEEQYSEYNSHSEDEQASNCSPSPNSSSLRQQESAIFKRPKLAPLTDQERIKMMAMGQCFRCRQRGHIARNCPWNNTAEILQPEHEDLSLYENDLSSNENCSLHQIYVGTMEFVPRNKDLNEHLPRSTIGSEKALASAYDAKHPLNAQVPCSRSKEEGHGLNLPSTIGYLAEESDTL